MAEEFWFGVTFTFTCPVCKVLGKQKATITSPTDDPPTVNAQLSRQRIACHNCGATIPKGTPIDVDVQGGTPDSLSDLGFPPVAN